MFLGVIGSVLGVLLGMLLAYGFFKFQIDLNLLPADVYKLDKIEVEIRWTDLIAIFSASLIICFLATLAPAFRGANLSPVEGIRHD